MDLPLDVLKDLFKVMVTAREMDLLEQEYTGRGEAFFHVSGAGHESTAALAWHLGPQDWLHCHYRDKALMLARGISTEQFFMSLFNKDGSHSRGRQMNAHMSSPEHKVLSLVGPVGNSALQAAGVANAVKHQKGQPIVLCALGDGMTQQGEVLEAVGQAVRDTLPVLFLIQDNNFAISTRTPGQTFFDLPDGPAKEFYGIPIQRLDGRDPLESYRVFGDIVTQMRRDRRPVILVVNVERLHNHTNADDQRMYRSSEEIEAAQKTGDPLERLSGILAQAGWGSDKQQALAQKIRSELRAEARKVQRGPEPKPVFDALKPLPPEFFDPRQEKTKTATDATGQTMIEAIRDVLNHHLAADERVMLFGEDLEDPKGDVFGLTRGLSTAYPGRVINSALAEATILGVAVGRALAGQRPVAFLQFADFLPIAYNQIISELGSMYWRTDGGWECPVIVMITCGGYKPGLGPFHASSFEALALHSPGVDVFMPSNAADAAGLLNTAFASGRPTLFFYPKNCLNERSLTSVGPAAEQRVPLGVARKLSQGNDLTLVGWGNTVTLCRKAAASLEEAGVRAEVLDLRSLAPWDKEAVAESIRRTGKLVITHEDSHSVGFGSEVAATMAEMVPGVKIRRVTRADTFVPCNFANQLAVLPSYQRILETCVELLGGTIEWEKPLEASNGRFLVPAIGASPSDESITVVKWLKGLGDLIQEGEVLAECEADKAALELKSPVSGTIEEVIVPEGHTVGVGAALLGVRPTDADEEIIKPVTKENPGRPRITGLVPEKTAKPGPVSPNAAGLSPEASLPGLVTLAGRKGSRVVPNSYIAERCPEWEAEEIFKRIGIESRPWVAEGEDALTLSVDAALKALAQSGASWESISLVLVATGTPLYTSPSMAALVQRRLNDHFGVANLAPAYDFTAACSGYVYGLSQAYDWLVRRPGDRVLFVTTEVLSPKINFKDPGTAPIFADAATATLIAGPQAGLPFKMRLHSPVLGAEGEDGGALCVPLKEGQWITMDGPKVFIEAVKRMQSMLRAGCEVAQVQPEDLDLVIPHQANQRILNAVAQRMKIDPKKVYSNIQHNGNTSSCTIPLALEDLWTELRKGQKLGLTAFGGGFTFAGGVLEVL